ncbi:hypothetical protein M6B38_182310 [Iris pallida]|uniref:Secreted protein n=1 Tax=Iris pallida TaxID=29817 RepID=A0AAX6DXC3_IRIPA|nr:hypothetical protein M6B38_218365 [Iris pallida]KAJ6805090.1 hypothetical protein M6B38_182310 [Iris pallida]
MVGAVLRSCSSWIQQVQVWIGRGCSTPRLVEEHTTSTARDCHWCWWRYDFGRANGGIGCATVTQLLGTRRLNEKASAEVVVWHMTTRHARVHAAVGRHEVMMS